MKKLWYLLLVTMISVGTIFPTYQSAIAASEVDQQYTSGAGSVAINSAFGRFAQIFKPTKSKLDKVEAELTGISGSKSISVGIRHRLNTAWEEGYVVPLFSQVVTNGWNTFDFSDIDVTVSDIDTYGIWTGCPEDGPQWKYTSGPSTYGRGYAIWQSNDMVDWDYNFKTYGYDPSAGDSTPSTDTVSTDTLTASGEAPSTSTSSSVEKPTDLKVEYSAEVNSKGDKLTWTASKTSSIDGYKIFRSETKGKSYVKIGQVEKAKVVYTDLTAVAGTTYYYVVRAYKGDSQSASSNEASITVPADAAPSSPTGLKIVSYTDTTISLSWTKNPESDISEYTLTTYIGSKQDKIVAVKSDKTEYTFKDLKPETTYRITVVAKNTALKTSSPSEVSQKTRSVLEGYNKKFEMSLLTWVLSGVGLVLILALIVLLYIRKRKIKKTKPPVIN